MEFYLFFTLSVDVNVTCNSIKCEFEYSYVVSNIPFIGCNSELYHPFISKDVPLYPIQLLPRVFIECLLGARYFIIKFLTLGLVGVHGLPDFKFYWIMSVQVN